MKLLKPILALLCALTFMPTVSAEMNETAAILALGFHWGATFDAGQMPALLNMYTGNAVIIPPSSEILADPAAIQSYWGKLKSIGMSDYRIDTIDIRIDGDVAYQLALWQASLTAGDGKVIHLDGNMTNVLQRQADGSWKIQLQSWN
ncbi:MAG: YybH family protein [Gammaproteobacteria bacterium]